MIVYAVTHSSYPDYGVERLFTEKPDAERYVESCGGDRIEEFELHETLEGEPRELHRMATFVVRQAGKVETMQVHEASETVFPGVNGPRSVQPVVHVSAYQSGPPGNFHDGFSITVTGYNPTTVRQAFSDAVVGKTAELEAGAVIPSTCGCSEHRPVEA